MSQAKTAKIILAIFFLVSLIWSLFTPVFEAPDETTAYEYGRYYARTLELPVLTQLPLPQGVHHWEPLYFVILGRIAKIIDAPLSDNSRYQYPQNWDRIRTENPTNLYRHEAEEFKFGWDKLALSLHVMRLVSVFLAVGSVWFIYKIGSEIFSQDSSFPIWAMILFGFNPQFIFFSGILNIVNMVTFLTAIFLWLLVKYLGRRDNEEFSVLILGAIFGITIFSKMTALAMLPAIILAIGWRRFEEKKSIVKGVLFFSIVFLLFGGWYLIRNQALYGEFTGAKAHVIYRFGRIINPFLEEVGLLNFIISYPKTQWTTFWSGFGWITVYLPLLFPLTMLIVYIHGIYGFVRELIDSKLGLNRIQKRQLIVLGLMPILVWLGITRVIFMVEVFHGKDLFLISGALALVVIIGLTSLLKRAYSRHGIGRLVKKTLLVITGILTMFWLKQHLLAEFLKGAATAAEVFQLILTGATGVMVLITFWSLLENTKLMTIVSRSWMKQRNRLPIITTGILAAINLLILFAVFIPAMYHRSIWQLIK